MKNLKDQLSDDEDSAPESISFVESKKENTEKAVKINEQINKIRESQKQKRIERQEKYIEQKKNKFENMKLPDDVLDALHDDSPSKSSTKSETKPQKIDKTPRSLKIPDEDETDLSKIAISSFAPSRVFSKYGISVVNLENTNKKPLISSDRAKNFKSIMYNRAGIRRETAHERLATIKKRKLVK